MPGIVLTSPEPLAGKTTVAVGLANMLFSQGRSVSIRRVGNDEHAETDATLFKALKGIPDESSAGVTLAEAPAGAAPSALADFPDSRVLVIAPASTPVDVVADYCSAAGDRVAGVITNKMPARRAETLLAEAETAGIQIFATLPEDRLLAAPVLRDVVQALSAESEHLDGAGLRPLDRPVIATISADPGQGYFARYDASAVIVRSDKPDLQLAALNAGADCLIVTGGLPILNYVLERAEEDEIPLIRTGLDTVAAVQQIEATFGALPFAGSDAKIKRITALVSEFNWNAVLR